MRSPRAWILNYGAEAELAGRTVEKEVPRGRPSWLTDDDVVVRAGSVQVLESGGIREGAAWCPTPAALGALRRAGVARLPVASSFDVLRQANARATFADVHPLRRFGAELGFASTEVEALVAHAAPARPSGRAPAWMLRTNLSASGQGRRLVETWDDKTAVWVERALGVGPVLVLPMVDVVDEFSCHAYLWSNGEDELGQHVTQTVRGAAWRGAEPRRHRVPALDQVRSVVVERLRSIGYVGPVGIDGFVWRDAAGVEHVAAGTDVNARYTMSMGAAFGEVPVELRVE